MTITFGTEGWRAVMAEAFTVENVRRVTQAIAEHFREHAPSSRAPVKMAVGYDTRFLSERFARDVSVVLAANGIHVVRSTQPIPTPALSRYIVAHRLQGGVMVTASHNPAAYNGLKVKEAFGGSATTETVGSIERRIARATPPRAATDESRDADGVTAASMIPDFLRGLQSYVDLRAIRRSRFRVLIDPMHGAGNGLTERLLTGGRLHVETIHGDPDPWFGGHAPEPIARHLGELKRQLVRRRWDLGLATDGDADRIGALASNGLFLNPGQILCLLLEHLRASRGWTGAVVKTVSNTSMIDRLAGQLGVRLIEVPVGFKHIAKLMLEDDVLIGGEESGGIGVRDYLPERDGILNGLLLLEAMVVRGTGALALLHQLERRFGTWRYARQDLRVSPERLTRAFRRLRTNPPTRVAGVGIINVNTLDGVKLIGRDDSWLLFRRSGTEPVVRVYAESLSTAKLARLLDAGVRLVTTA